MYVVYDFYRREIFLLYTTYVWNKPVDDRSLFHVTIQHKNISGVFEEILTDVFNQVNFLHVFVFDIRHHPFITYGTYDTA